MHTQVHTYAHLGATNIFKIWPKTGGILKEFYLFYLLIEEGGSTLIIRLNNSNDLFSLPARITSWYSTASCIFLIPVYYKCNGNTQVCWQFFVWFFLIVVQVKIILI